MQARRSHVRSLTAWAMIGISSLAATVATQQQLKLLPPPYVDVNMLFVPPPALTKQAATGFENLVADGLWLGLIQYYGERLETQTKIYVNLSPMLELITDLDPHFWFAYWLGAWALGDNKELDAAVRLLEKGERNNPQDFNYPYLQGFIQFLFRKDYAAAAACFERAATRPNADRFARTMAARMLQKQGLDQQALAIWQRLYDADSNKVTKEIAHRNIERIKAEMAGLQKRVFPVGHRPGEAP